MQISWGIFASNAARVLASPTQVPRMLFKATASADHHGVMQYSTLFVSWVPKASRLYPIQVPWASAHL